MGNRSSKVIGYFAYASKTEVLCTEINACLIAGSDQAMRRYLIELDPGQRKAWTVKKTRFGEIHRGLSLGAAYAFDEESYKKFYPLAIKEGLPVEKGDFQEMKKQDKKFFTVQIVIV
jgi:hypothetical protein